MLKQSAHIKSPDIPLSSLENVLKQFITLKTHSFKLTKILCILMNDVRDEFQVMFHELDSDVSLEEVNKGIKQFKLSKSAVPDNYLNEYFIHGNT